MGARACACVRLGCRNQRNHHEEDVVRLRLSKLARWSTAHGARRTLVAAGALGVTGVLATVALASGATSASTNWSTVQSASAGGGMTALIAAAKQEGTLNVIALPTNWANYGAEMSAFEKLYGIKINSENPSGSSAQEIQAIKTSRGRSVRTGRRRRRWRVRVRGRQRGPVCAL